MTSKEGAAIHWRIFFLIKTLFLLTRVVIPVMLDLTTVVNDCKGGGLNESTV